MIPELGSALQVAQVWVRDMIYSINSPGRARGAMVFLTVVMRAIRLSLACDTQAAGDYLPRVPCVALHRPEQLLRRPEQAYIVQDFLGLMQNREANALNRGILFLKYVHVRSPLSSSPNTHDSVTSWITRFPLTLLHCVTSWSISAAPSLSHRGCRS